MHPVARKFAVAAATLSSFSVTIKNSFGGTDSVVISGKGTERLDTLTLADLSRRGFSDGLNPLTIRQGVFKRTQIVPAVREVQELLRDKFDIRIVRLDGKPGNETYVGCCQVRQMLGLPNSPRLVLDETFSKILLNLRDFPDAKKQGWDVAGSAGFKFNGLVNKTTNDPIIAKTQAMLKDAGFFQDTPDGYLGVKTMAALIAYQQSRDIKDELGILGPRTFNALSTLQPSRGKLALSFRLHEDLALNSCTTAQKETISKLMQSDKSTRCDFINKITSSNYFKSLPQRERDQLTDFILVVPEGGYTSLLYYAEVMGGPQTDEKDRFAQLDTQQYTLNSKLQLLGHATFLPQIEAQRDLFIVQSLQSILQIELSNNQVGMTCAAAASIRFDYPAELLRKIIGLASDGSVKLTDGTSLSFDPDSLSDEARKVGTPIKPSTNVLSMPESMLQTAIMDYTIQLRLKDIRYNPISDKYINSYTKIPTDDHGISSDVLAEYLSASTGKRVIFLNLSDMGITDFCAATRILHSRTIIGVQYDPESPGQPLRYHSITYMRQLPHSLDFSDANELIANKIVIGDSNPNSQPIGTPIFDGGPPRLFLDRFTSALLPESIGRIVYIMQEEK